MKRIRLLSLLLVPALALALLAACGGSKTPAGSDSPDPAGSNSPAASTPITLKVSSVFNEGSIMCDSLEHMCALIEEATGGSITFDRFYGGTLCTLPEEFRYVVSGAVDLAAPMQGTAASVMPLWQNPALGNDAATGVDISNYIANEDPVTAPLLQAQAEAAGVHPFGYNVGDYNAIVCRTAASSLDDLMGRAFGIPAQGAAVYEAYGLSVVTCETADAYESLSRGVVDTFCAGISSIAGMRLYENGQSCLVIPSTGGTGIVMMNQATWNKLSAEQQAIVTKAYEDTLAWMKERYANELLPGYEAAIGQKCNIVYVEGEELARMNDIRQTSAAASYRAAAETAGCLTDYETVTQAAIEYAAQVNAAG